MGGGRGRTRGETSESRVSRREGRRPARNTHQGGVRGGDPPREVAGGAARVPGARDGRGVPGPTHDARRPEGVNAPTRLPEKRATAGSFAERFSRRCQGLDRVMRGVERFLGSLTGGFGFSILPVPASPRVYRTRRLSSHQSLPSRVLSSPSPCALGAPATWRRRRRRFRAPAPASRASRRRSRDPASASPALGLAPSRAPSPRRAPPRRRPGGVPAPTTPRRARSRPSSSPPPLGVSRRRAGARSRPPPRAPARASAGDALRAPPRPARTPPGGVPREHREHDRGGRDEKDARRDGRHGPGRRRGVARARRASEPPPRRGRFLRFPRGGRGRNAQAQQPASGGSRRRRRRFLGRRRLRGRPPRGRDRTRARRGRPRRSRRERRARLARRVRGSRPRRRRIRRRCRRPRVLPPPRSIPLTRVVVVDAVFTTSVLRRGVFVGSRARPRAVDRPPLRLHRPRRLPPPPPRPPRDRGRVGGANGGDGERRFPPRPRQA